MSSTLIGFCRKYGGGPHNRHFAGHSTSRSGQMDGRLTVEMQLDVKSWQGSRRCSPVHGVHAEIGKMAPSFPQLIHPPPSLPTLLSGCMLACLATPWYLTDCRHYSTLHSPKPFFLSLFLGWAYPACHFLHVPRDCTLTCSGAFSDWGVTCPRDARSRLTCLTFGLWRRIPGPPLYRPQCCTP